MALRDLRNPAPEKLVKVSDQESFPVRGLSPAQVLGLYYRHTGDLSALFEKFTAQAGAPETSDIQSIVIGLLRDTPVILSELIALGSGSDPRDNENWQLDLAVAEKFTFSVQADALSKIGELTFTSDMPPGKFLAVVTQAARSVTTAIASPKA